MTSPEKLDEIARIFDASKDFDGVLARYGAELVRGRLSCGRTLEMGCSNGVMTELLWAEVEALEVVDGSAVYIEDVRRRLPDNSVRFFCALFEEFEPPAPYDDIILARGLEHVRDPVSVLRRAASWLATGGSLHVIVPNAWSFHRLLGVEMGLLKDMHDLSDRDRMLDHQRVYDPDLLRRDLEAAGLAVVETSGVLLKFLPNAASASLDPALIDGSFRLGFRFPEYCAEIYARCRRRSGQA